MGFWKFPPGCGSWQRGSMGEPAPRRLPLLCSRPRPHHCTLPPAGPAFAARVGVGVRRLSRSPAWLLNRLHTQNCLPWGLLSWLCAARHPGGVHRWSSVGLLPWNSGGCWLAAHGPPQWPRPTVACPVTLPALLRAPGVQCVSWISSSRSCASSLRSHSRTRRCVTRAACHPVVCTMPRVCGRDLTCCPGPAARCPHRSSSVRRCCGPWQHCSSSW